jgi:hypothetical protein
VIRGESHGRHIPYNHGQLRSGPSWNMITHSECAAANRLAGYPRGRQSARTALRLARSFGVIYIAYSNDRNVGRLLLDRHKESRRPLKYGSNSDNVAYGRSFAPTPQPDPGAPDNPHSGHCSLLGHHRTIRGHIPMRYAIKPTYPTP